MTDEVIVKFPRAIARRLRREARRLGIGLEEYVLELILRDLDPPERAKEYIEASEDLLKQAQEELKKGAVRQATEKTWGAAALTVKAYAEWREARRLISHGELWEYKRGWRKSLGNGLVMHGPRQQQCMSASTRDGVVRKM